MPWPHMLFYSGEVKFVTHDVMNNVSDIIFIIIRRLMRFVPDCQELLRMRSLFE
jgi:hypothetical protein